MTATENRQTIRIYVSFTASLDECPSCAFEQEFADEFGKVECPRCDYHTGADLAGQWMDFCERVAEPPVGEITYTHYGDGNYFEIEIPQLPSAAELRTLDAWIREIGGSVDDDSLAGVLTKDADVWLQLAVNYSAHPVNPYRSYQIHELYALRDELNDSKLDETATTERSRDALKTDRQCADWAITQAQAGKSVFVAQDEDGYYFAVQVE